MKIEREMVKGWYELVTNINPKWRWWSFWRDKYIVTKNFISDKKGDAEQEMTVCDFEGATIKEVYDEIRLNYL